GVDHVQRPEQVRLQELVERLTGSHLDNTREEIVGETVVPDLASLMRKWKPGQAGDEVGESLVPAIHAGRAIEAFVKLVYVGAVDTINQAGGMAQQILDRHRALLRLKRETGLAGHRVFG